MDEKRLAEIEARRNAATKGPWRWFGNAGSNSLYLATTHSGRRYVMDFVRWGFNQAQPRFQHPRGIMTPARDLLKFEVGDKSVVGYGAAKRDGSVYRYDVIGIDHPDARFIEESYTDITDLIAEVRRLQKVNHELLDAVCQVSSALHHRVHSHDAVVAVRRCGDLVTKYVTNRLRKIPAYEAASGRDGGV